MIFEKEFNEIINSDKYKSFKEQNQLSYLSSIFILDNNLQFDFYNKETDKITSFTLKDKEITSEESKVFKQENSDVKELKLDKVKVDIKKVKSILSKSLEKYNQREKKEIIILQSQEEPLWNVSYITTEFKLLNVKIDAISGQILSEKIESVLNFKS